MSHQNKLCKCGCGIEISLLDKRGRPHNFLKGHNSKLLHKNILLKRRCLNCGGKAKRKFKRGFCEKCYGRFCYWSLGRREKNKLYRKTHKKEIREGYKKWAKEHRDIKLRNRKRYYERHKQEIYKRQRDYVNEWRRKNYDKLLPKKLKWFAEHGGLKRPQEYWRNRYVLIVERATICAFCGSDKNLEAHHIDGNKNNNKLENLMILCFKCHRGYKTGIHSKGNKTLEEWLNPQIEEIQKERS